MRPLRYSINVTLDGCCDHRAMVADDELHRRAMENIARADAQLFGRVIYQMMEEAWRGPSVDGSRPEWMEPFARTIDASKKYVVSRTLERVDWNAELIRGDLRTAVEELKREPGNDLIAYGGATFDQALSRAGLVDEYRLMIQPAALGAGLPLFKDLSDPLHLELVEAMTFASGVAIHVYR